MRRVELLKKLGRHAQGSVHDVGDRNARRLVDKGDAKYVDLPKPRVDRPKKTQPEKSSDMVDDKNDDLYEVTATPIRTR